MMSVDYVWFTSTVTRGSIWNKGSTAEDFELSLCSIGCRPIPPPRPACHANK